MSLFCGDKAINKWLQRSNVGKISFMSAFTSDSKWSQTNYMPTIFSEGTEGSGELRSSNSSHFHRPKQEQSPSLRRCPA